MIDYQSNPALWQGKISIQTMNTSALRLQHPYPGTLWQASQHLLLCHHPYFRHQHPPHDWAKDLFLAKRDKRRNTAGVKVYPQRRIEPRHKLLTVQLLLPAQLLLHHLIEYMVLELIQSLVLLHRLCTSSSDLFHFHLLGFGQGLFCHPQLPFRLLQLHFKPIGL